MKNLIRLKESRAVRLAASAVAVAAAVASGVGRTHGRFGLDEMVRVKYVDTDRLPGMKKVWWHGYGESFRRQMEGFLDMQFGRGWARMRGAVRAAGVVRRKRL